MANYPLKGLTSEHRDFLKQYALTKLSSSSMNKAILHLINEQMQNTPTKPTPIPIEQLPKQRKRVQITLRPEHYQQLAQMTAETDMSIQYYIISLILKDLEHKDRLNGVQLVELRRSNYAVHKISVTLKQIAEVYHDKADIDKKQSEAIENIIIAALAKLDEHVSLVKTLLRQTLEKY